jgi:hypothetical protein
MLVLIYLGFAWVTGSGLAMPHNVAGLLSGFAFGAVLAILATIVYIRHEDQDASRRSHNIHPSQSP